MQLFRPFQKNNISLIYNYLHNKTFTTFFWNEKMDYNYYYYFFDIE